MTGARRLLGENMLAVTVVAGQPMPAVLVIPGRSTGPAGTDPCAGFPCPPTAGASPRSNGVAIEGITFDAHGIADFAVFGGALTRSRMAQAGFHNGRVAGLYIGYGWINARPLPPPCPLLCPTLAAPPSLVLPPLRSVLCSGGVPVLVRLHIQRVRPRPHRPLPRLRR